MKSKLSSIVASPHDARDYQFQPSGIAVPDTIDLSGYNLPIRDQAREGDCTGFAVLRAVENMVFRATGQKIRLAPQFPYEISRARQNRLTQEGDFLRDILEIGRTVGYCIEEAFPYTPDDENTTPPQAAFDDAKKRLVIRYESIPIDTTGNDLMLTINNLNAALAEAAENKGSTIIFAIKVTDQIFGLSGPWQQQNYLGVGATQYHYVGNHAMTIDGKIQSLQRYKTGNQWTEEWGDAGYGGIPFATMASDIIEAWIIRSVSGADMTDKDVLARQTTVTQLYAAMFGRAPEAGGLNYWVSQLASGRPVEQVAQSMYNCDPSRAYYPAGATSQQIIQKFYVNVLGRVPDAGGLAYWKGQLDSGKSQGQVIIDMINAVVGYAGTDAAALASQALFANKVAVGLYCGIDLACDSVNAASSLLPLVTADPASVEAAKLHLRQMLSSGGLL